jgi:hypothetical protein
MNAGMLELLHGQQNALYGSNLVDMADRTTPEYKEMASSLSDLIDVQKNIASGSIM